jgi:hypothetical protein
MFQGIQHKVWTLDTNMWFIIRAFMILNQVVYGMTSIMKDLYIYNLLLPSKLRRHMLIIWRDFIFLQFAFEVDFFFNLHAFIKVKNIMGKKWT